MQSHFYTRQASLYLSISPKYSLDITKGIHLSLNNHILNYIPQLKGILISYAHIKPQTDYAKIISDNPYLYLTITAEFTLFSPQPGNILIGRVNKLSSDHIGLLCYGLFNASINAECITEDIEYNDQEQSWGEIVNGSTVVFEVKKLLVLNSCFSIQGTLKGSSQLGSISLDLLAQ